MAFHQFEMIWEELGTKFRDLLVMGRSGVIASLIASSHKLSLHEHKVSKCIFPLPMSINTSYVLKKCGL